MTDEQISIPYNFEYRGYQEPQFTASQDGILRLMKCWHRRAGKDLTDINFTILKMLERKGNYWHLLPEYAQARKAIWQGKTKEGVPYLDCFPEEIVKRKLEQQMMIELVNGSMWQLVGSDNIDKAVGAGPAGVVLSEYSLTDPRTWALIEPMLLENGGWASFNFTPRGKNHAHKLFELAKKNPKWFTQLLTIDDTFDLDGKPIVTKEMIEELRRMGTDEETIQQEYYCSFKGSMQGAYYARQLSELEDAQPPRITEVPYRKEHPVYTYWDIGRSDYTTIWFMQKIGYEFRIIDYFQDHGKEISDYAKDLKDKGYIYEKHTLPHDAANKVIQHKYSCIEQLQMLMPKEKFECTKKTASVQADIYATRSFLPRCVFDATKCELGLEALKGYTKKYNDLMKTYADEPMHNWASHGADAFRELAISNMEEYNLPRPVMDNNGLPTFDSLIQLARMKGQLNDRI